MKNKTMVIYIESIIVAGCLIALGLLGRVMPSFGWFLSQPVVKGTLFVIWIAFGFYKIIEAEEVIINESSPRKEVE